MDQLAQLAAIAALAVLLAIGWLLTLVGLPGNWLMVLATVAYAWAGPQAHPLQIDWSTVIGLTVLAGVGELLELVAGVWGARRVGGSRRAALYSLIGSIAGAIVGAGAGLPIPIIGSAVGAVLGAATGALAGAALAEHSRGETMDRALQVGHAAFWGRLWGTGAKLAIGSLMVAVILASLVI